MKPHRINFSDNSKDLEVALLAEAGFSGAYISDKTLYSRGQVYTRARKAGIKLSAYRNGEGWVAAMVRKQIRNYGELEVKKISKHLADVERKALTEA